MTEQRSAVGSVSRDLARDQPQRGRGDESSDCREVPPSQADSRGDITAGTRSSGPETLGTVTGTDVAGTNTSLLTKQKQPSPQVPCLEDSNPKTPSESTGSSKSSGHLPRNLTPKVVVVCRPGMASDMSFADWRQANSEGLMATAEALLDKLEGVADLLTQIEEKDMVTDRLESDELDEDRANIISRFHEGVESARGVVGVLKREKWRLSKREMSVELRMGELEDYKSHLRSDMSSLNQTVDALSMRVVQLENQLVDAQEIQENLEADVLDRKRCGEQQTAKIAELQSEKSSLRDELRLYQQHTSHTLATKNKMLENELLILRDENHRLKDLVRTAESHKEHTSATDGDYLSRLTNDFLKELSSLEVENSIRGQSNMADSLTTGAKYTTNPSSF